MRKTNRGLQKITFERNMLRNKSLFHEVSENEMVLQTLV